MIKILIAIITIISTIGASAQNVNIPDANFKAYLVGDSTINTNYDSQIQVSEASSFEGTIDCSNMNISDLTGIEAFTAVTMLFCETNNLTQIDVTKNVALFRFYCNGNSLSQIDVTQNTALNMFYCQENNLTEIDLSKNAALMFFFCYDNSISTLDFTNNPMLRTVWCFDNILTTLTLTSNPGLQRLFCYDNLLTELDVHNTSLVSFNAHNNKLTSLNMANNYNHKLTSPNFSIMENPDLTCVKVDDVAYSTTNWTNIEAGVNFSLGCSSVGTREEVNNFNFSMYPNPAINYLTIDFEGKAISLVISDATGKIVKTTKSSNKTVDVSSLTKGIYFLQMQTDKGLISKRFIKK